MNFFWDLETRERTSAPAEKQKYERVVKSWFISDISPGSKDMFSGESGYRARVHAKNQKTSGSEFTTDRGTDAKEQTGVTRRE